MCKKTIFLSSAGLKNLVIRGQERGNQFTFQIGKLELTMHDIFAEFISPKVSHIHECDPTINSIKIDDYFTEQLHLLNFNIDSLIKKKQLTKLEQISSGYPVEIEAEESDTFRYLSLLLGNEELYSLIDKLYPQDIKKLTIDDLIQKIQVYQLFSNDKTNNYSSFYSNIIDQISIQFNTYDKKKLKQIPLPILYSILINDNFQRKNEDELIDFINEISIPENDDNKEELNIFDFYETIDFSKLSKNKLKEFLSKIDYREMTFTFWTNLCNFITGDKIQSNNNEEQGLKIEFNGDTNNRFCGIINYLSKRSGGNVCDKGIVDVTASTINYNQPKNVVDLASDAFFQTYNQPNQWLKYDFKEKKVRPTHYSMKSRTDNCEGGSPENWVIEGSNSNLDNDWKILDTHKSDTTIKKPRTSATFEIKEQNNSNESYRYLRLRQIGNSSCNNDFLTITSLEYFGTLIENPQ